MIIKITKRKLNGPLLPLALLVWLLLLDDNLLLLFDNNLRRGGFRESMEMAPAMCFRDTAIVPGGL